MRAQAHANVNQTPGDSDRRRCARDLVLFVQLIGLESGVTRVTQVNGTRKGSFQFGGACRSGRGGWWWWGGV